MILKRLDRKRIKLSGTGGQLAFSAFSQLVRYGAPLLFYPIFIRTVSTEDFAVFVLCMAAGQTIGQFTEFGFGLSAVRALTHKDENENGGALAFGQVMCGKLLMLSVSAPIYVLISFMISQDFLVVENVVLPILIGFSYGFTPNWYYIGVRRAHLLAMGEILVSLTQLVLVLLLVHEGSGFVIMVMTMTLPILGLSLLGQIQAFRALSFRAPSRAEMWTGIRTAYHFFVASNAPALTNRLFILILGAMSTATQVAIYAAAERIVSAAVNMLTPMMRVLLPRVTVLYAESPSAAFVWFRRVLILLSGFYIIATFTVIVTVDWWVPLVFGRDFAKAAGVIAVFLLVAPLSTMSRIVGLLWLVPSQLEASYQRVTLVCCALGLLVALPVGREGATEMAILRVFIEVCILLGCVVVLLRSCRRAPEKL